MIKPGTAAGYDVSLAVEAKRMCLYLATILGDLMEEVVLVGGLVPYLLVDQDTTRDPHVGTRDLDLGLSLAVLDDERYQEISARLRARGFQPGVTGDGRITRQTWVHGDSAITVDFLIPQAPRGPAAGRLQSLERDFAAIVTPPLSAAFRDQVSVVLDDVTLESERTRRAVNVCGPAAFVVLKAHALDGRGENKDAYDLVYVLTNFGDGTTDEVAARFASILHLDVTREALALLARDFDSPQGLGPTRSAAFRSSPPSEVAKVDAFGYVQALLSRLRSP